MSRSAFFLAATLTASTFASAEGVGDSIYRMSPKQVLELRQTQRSQQQAIYSELDYSREVVDETLVTFEPGEVVQGVFVKERAPTTISFVDATGTPWPVKDVKAYDGTLFGAVLIDNSFKNSVVLHGKLPAGSSYLAVFLKDEPAPITLRVEAGTNRYHQLKTYRIQKVGPETEITMDTLNAADQIGLEPDSDLNNVLFGVPPYGSKKMKTDNPEIIAFEKDGDLLVRSKLPIFSPQSKRNALSTTGYVAYRFKMATRLYATSSNGKVVKIKVED